MRDDNKSQFCLLPSRERERENERDDLKEENFLASGKKVNFWDPKQPSSLKFMWITLLPFLRHRPTKASSSFVPEALSFVIVRSAVFWARFRILRGRRYLLVAFSSVSVARHHLCISLFLKSYSSALYIIHTKTKRRWISLLIKEREREKKWTRALLLRSNNNASERDKAAAVAERKETRAFAFALLCKWWRTSRYIKWEI